MRRHLFCLHVVGVVHYVRSVKFIIMIISNAYATAYSYEKCCFPVINKHRLKYFTFQIILSSHVLSIRKLGMLSACPVISEMTYYVSSGTLNSTYSVCLPHFPTCNYNFRLHGDVISQWETRKYHFPSPAFVLQSEHDNYVIDNCNRRILRTFRNKLLCTSNTSILYKLNAQLR